MKIQKNLQYIEDFCHLGENEDPMSTGLFLPKQSGEFLELATVVLEQRGIRERNLQLYAGLVKNGVKSKRIDDWSLPTRERNTGQVAGNDCGGDKRKFVNKAGHLLRTSTI